MNFLDTLFLNGYHPIEEDTPQTSELIQAKKELAVYEQQIIDTMGYAFFDLFFTAQNSVHTLELAYAHTQGIRFVLNLIQNPSIENELI